jgi:hypothetical protein
MKANPKITLAKGWHAIPGWPREDAGKGTQSDFPYWAQRPRMAVRAEMCNPTPGQVRMQFYRVLLLVRALSSRLIADSKAA